MRVSGSVWSGRAVGVCALSMAVGMCGHVAVHVGSGWLHVPVIPPHLSKTVATCLWSSCPQTWGSPQTTHSAPQPLFPYSPRHPPLSGLIRPQTGSCSQITRQTSFPTSPPVLTQSLTFTLYLCFDLPGSSWPQAPLFSCQHPLVPLFLSCTNLAKSWTCLNLFPCLPLQLSL